MSVLRNLGQTQQSAPRGPWERRVLLWIIGIVVGAVVVIVAAYHLDAYTEGKEFCGLLCHPNHPQYVTHEVSAHAKVECGVCHVGPGLTPKVVAKIYGVGELVSLITNSYERPIEPPVKRLRPAEEICEQCHWADKPYADRLHLVSAFAEDEENTETRTQYKVRIRAGDGQRPGAHWHTENVVWYVALDPVKQHIPWAAVQEGDEVIAYRDQNASLSANELEALPRRQMDCLDCHSRPAHDFRNPAELLDEAIAEGRVDRELPFVKREGLKLLSGSHPTQEAGIQAMEDLHSFYRTQYADLYAQKQVAVAQAVAELQRIYRESVFPEMNLTWEVYPNNIGHADLAGCFRCHDGKHVNAQEEPIPANCTTCHSVPIISGAGQAVAGELLMSQVASKPAPASHLSPTFRWEHRLLANDSCSECHGSIRYGDDNSGFCANGACHGQEWAETFQEASFEHPIQLLGSHAEQTCNECHQGTEPPSLGNCASCHEPPAEPRPHYGTECAQCHTPFGWRDSAAAWLAVISTIPHRVDATMDCRSCHAEGGMAPIPDNHATFASSTCLRCHEGSSAAMRAPKIPHVIEGRAACLVCHKEDGLKPVPADHQGRTNESCLLCHETMP